MSGGDVFIVSLLRQLPVEQKEEGGGKEEKKAAEGATKSVTVGEEVPTTIVDNNDGTTRYMVLYGCIWLYMVYPVDCNYHVYSPCFSSQHRHSRLTWFVHSFILVLVLVLVLRHLCPSIHCPR